MDKIVKVKSVKHLRELLGEYYEFCILLNGGLKSVKYIDLSATGKFLVENSIDGSYQSLTEKGLYSQSNIGKAIDKGAFFCVKE